MTPEELNAALASARAAAEQNVLADLADAYRRVLRAAGRRMASAFRRQAVVLAADARFVPPDGDEVVDVDRLAADLARRTAFLQRQAAAELENALAREGVISYEVGGVFNEELMEAVGKRATFATEEDLRDTFRETIERAADEGWSITRTSEEIIDDVDAMAEYRAEALARTDLISLANARSQATAELAFEGTDARKRWLATNDERTRDTHAEADGQTVPIKEAFTVGGAPLRYPGDPLGAIEEVMNCRCTQVYEETPAMAVEAEENPDPLAALKPSAAKMTESVDYWNSENAETTARENGLDLADFKYHAEEKLRRELADAPIKIRAPWHVAPKIVEDGRFKSQHETRTSSGLLSDSIRQNAEHHMFGYPLDLPADQRPIYGYIGDVTEERGSVGGYGMVSFVLKNSAKKRATFTTTDSLGSPLVPSPISRPSILSVYRNYVEELYLDKPIDTWDTVYFEAQIHGGVTMEDVERIEVYYDELSMTEQAFEETVERLRELTGGRIPIEVIRYQWDPELLGSAGSGPSLGEDRLGVEVAGRVLPVAASEDRLEGQLVEDDAHRAVEDASASGGGVVGTALREEQEVALASDPDDLHAPDSSEGSAGRHRAGRLRSATKEVEMTQTAVPKKQKLAAESSSGGDGDVRMIDPVAWNSTLCVEGAPTEDGRLLERGSLTWRDLPLTLMGLTSTGYGHEGAEAAGRIDTIDRNGDDIDAVGELTTEFGVDKLAPMIEDRTVRGVSVDLAVQEWEIRNAETGDVLDGEEEIIAWLEGTPTLFTVLDGVILGATVCPMPAIADAEINIAAGGMVVVASAVTPHGIRMTVWTPFERAPLVAGAAQKTIAPPRGWFETAEFPGPTPLTFAFDKEVGLTRVFGHLADWTTCHTGIQGVCITAPRSPSNYAYFHVGEVETAEGDFLNVGKIMVGSRHASLQASRMQATRHYDDNGHVGCQVRAHDGEHGIWLSGFVPGFVSDEIVAELRANPPSGDWREVSRQLELIAACSVPVPGFPLPRVETSIVAGAGEMTIAAMILNSGIIVPHGEVRSAMIAAGCGCEEELALLDEGVDDLAELSVE